MKIKSSFGFLGGGVLIPPSYIFLFFHLLLLLLCEVKRQYEWVHPAPASLCPTFLSFLQLLDTWLPSNEQSLYMAWLGCNTFYGQTWYLTLTLGFWNDWLFGNRFWISQHSKGRWGLKLIIFNISVLESEDVLSTTFAMEKFRYGILQLFYTQKA